MNSVAVLSDIQTTSLPVEAVDEIVVNAIVSRCFVPFFYSVSHLVAPFFAFAVSVPQLPRCHERGSLFWLVRSRAVPCKLQSAKRATDVVFTTV